MIYKTWHDLFFFLLWLGFASEDLGGLSTSDAGSFVAEESYAGQANSATAAAGEGCCRGWDCGDTGLSPTSLLLEGSSTNVLKAGG